MNLLPEDYIAIGQLYIRYSFLVDMDDRDGWVESCWTRDGEYIGFRDGGPRSKGWEELKEQGRRALVPNEFGYHWNTSPLIEPTDYGASGRCYLLYIVAGDDGRFGEVRYALYYRDELVKQDGRWLFRRRNTTALPQGRRGCK